MDVSVEEKKGPAALEKFGFKKQDGPMPVEVGLGKSGGTPSPMKSTKGKSSPAKKASSGKGTLEAFGFGK